MKAPAVGERRLLTDFTADGFQSMPPYNSGHVGENITPLFALTANGEEEAEEEGEGEKKKKKKKGVR